jgi:effector-binding domain-containing protein
MEYELSVKEVAAEHIVSVRGRYRIAQLQLVVARELARVVSALLAQGLRPSGGALAIYHGWTDDAVDVELGYPADGAFSAPGSGVVESTLPGGKVLFGVHVGPYTGIGKAYEAMMAYAEANHLVLSDTMWERYVTDPACEPDESKYVTEIGWPLA